ncbi:MAG: hypothetical protein BVN35_18415 [Proteobacteria bacterium ST_bin11]|nr:MAG: hypothetical protein BVN35_18415 [Proteobacteria bacterium ST_bin11]
MKTHKQVKHSQLAAAILMCLCTATGTTFAAGPGSGSGGGSGGGSGSGSGSGGSGGGGEGTGEIFGDLYKLLRDARGVPRLTAELCQQPIAAPGVALPASPSFPGCTPASASASCTIPVDPATCAVVVGYETYLQAVDFARMSVARSPDSVMDKQLADVLVNLSTAQCLTLDPAGRLVYSNPDSADADGDGDTAELLSSAVDSPLQNLAIYREMVMKGALGTPAIALPKPFNGYTMLDTAAKALGAAADKGGKIDLDLVIYLNQIMGLDQATTSTVLPKIPLTIRQEVQGSMQNVVKYFLDYGSYGYARANTYTKLPYPANIPANQPISGCFDYLTLYDDATTDDGAPLFYIDSAGIYPTVFSGLPGFTEGNVGGFAQASDDARAVIDFMHSHPVLAGYEAPVLCQAAPPPAAPVDLSSKLQMPIRMVGNTTREGTLTVVNLKGAAASGTVQIKGIDSKQQQVLNTTYSFSGLATGQSQSWTVVFKGPSYATTINWTATVTANPSTNVDSNLTNNTATAKTTVMAARGSGGGEGE